MPGNQTYLCIFPLMKLWLLAIATVLLLVISGCGQSYNPELDRDCPGCDLSGIAMAEDYLHSADLTNANLEGAYLDDVIGAAGFFGAQNASARYR